MRKAKVFVDPAVDQYRITWDIETDETTIKTIILKKQRKKSQDAPKEFKRLTEGKDFVKDQSSLKDNLDVPDDLPLVTLQEGDKVVMEVVFKAGEPRNATAVVPSQFPNNNPLEINLRITGGSFTISRT